MDEKIDLDPKLIFNIVIFVSLGIVLTLSYIIISEIFDAKKECENIGGNYKIERFTHLCNNETFIKYSDGSWKLEQKSINLSDFTD